MRDVPLVFLRALTRVLRLGEQEKGRLRPGSHWRGNHEVIGSYFLVASRIATVHSIITVLASRAVSSIVLSTSSSTPS